MINGNDKAPSVFRKFENVLHPGQLFKIPYKTRSRPKVIGRTSKKRRNFESFISFKCIFFDLKRQGNRLPQLEAGLIEEYKDNGQIEKEKIKKRISGIEAILGRS